MEPSATMGRNQGAKSRTEGLASIGRGDGGCEAYPGVGMWEVPHEADVPRLSTFTPAA